MFSNPNKILLQSHIGEDMVIVDAGSGAGYYAYALAALVGKHGKVYAVDLNQDMLQKLSNEASKRKLRNLEVIHADIEMNTGLPAYQADRVIFANILFQLEHKAEALSEAKRLLKKNGKLVIVDWADSYSQIGPHPSHVVRKEEALKLCKNAGFSIDKELEAGEHHYGILCSLTPHHE